MSETRRVVQWATGTIGSRALRAVIEHPGLELAGVYVHSPDKAGRDAGELCGLDPTTGIKATSDVEEILALGADCVLYMPLPGKPEEICRLLASGANVVATSGQSHHPAGLEPALRERFEDACERGGSTLYSTGSSPGFITESLPLVLAGVQRRLDRLTINEYADVSRRPSPKMIFKVMGFGEPPGAAFDPRRLAHLREGFGPSLRATAEALSIPLDDVRATGETATAREDLRIAAGVLRAGTMAAQRITVSGLRAGREVLRFRANWYCSTDTEPAWDLRPTGWRVEVDGDAPLDIDLRFPFPIERMAEISPSYTANPAVNAVPAVCAAAPGIRTTADLFGPAPQLG